MPCRLSAEPVKVPVMPLIFLVDGNAPEYLVGMSVAAIAVAARSSVAAKNAMVRECISSPKRIVYRHKFAVGILHDLRLCAKAVSSVCILSPWKLLFLRIAVVTSMSCESVVVLKRVLVFSA